MDSTLVINILRTYDAKNFSTILKNKQSYQTLLKSLKLKENTSLIDFTTSLLTVCRELLNEEKRKDAVTILKFIKPLLPSSSTETQISFYLAVTDSFVMNNEYDGGKQAAIKALNIAQKIKNADLEIKAINRLFIIERTLGEKEVALEYLKKSKKLAEEINNKENIVFCEINSGLIHFFDKDYKKAADYCITVIEQASSASYPVNKLNMVMDYFIQVFTENQGLIIVDKYKETIRKGVSLVLKALKEVANVMEAMHRLMLVIALIKISDELLLPSLKEVENQINTFGEEKRALYLSAVARGLGDYDQYKTALMYYEKALRHEQKIPEDFQLTIKKDYGHLLSKSLNINMVYDLASSPSVAQNLKNIAIICEEPTLIGKANDKIVFRNAIVDSDAVYGLTREFIRKRWLEGSIKDRYTLKKALNRLIFDKSKEDVIEEVELIIINVEDQENNIMSLLLIGSTTSEKGLIKKKKEFEGYQLIGHIVPKYISKQKHFEEWAVKLLYNITQSSQKFKTIEIITNSKNIDVNFEPLIPSPL